MATFAILDENSLVINRVVSETAEYVYLALGSDTILVEETDTTGPACIGEKYLPSGIFQPPRPYPSWTWSETLVDWEPPTACPVSEKRHVWDEESLAWIEFIPPSIEE